MRFRRVTPGKLLLAGLITACLSGALVPASANAAPGGGEAEARATASGNLAGASANRAGARQRTNRRKRAKISVKLTGLKNRRSEIMGLVGVRGGLAPFVAGEKVEIHIYRNGKPLRRKSVRLRKGDGNYGYFTGVVRPNKPGKWAVAAVHRPSKKQRGAITKRKSWKLTYPSIASGECGPHVVGFKRHLRKMGYITNGGKCLKSRTERGILAYRRVNGMSETFKASSSVVKPVYHGKGGYDVRYPGTPGVHMEVPLSKQVLVFADGKKPEAIYPISSGKPSTPTVTGSYQMDWTQPGYNDLDMYYSWYFHRGYAVHGYNSVPDYPASHGCIRTFIADQPEIFNRISEGDWIHIW